MKQIYAIILTLLCGQLMAQRALTSESTLYIDSVYAYEYAPGQHATMTQAEGYAKKFSGENDGYILLGGWGGHVDGGFDHSVYNRGGYDFGVYSQPGVVFVMQDENGNGAPDDTWYELSGSETDSAGYIPNYEVTFYKPGTAKNDLTKVIWKDNQGLRDTLDKAKWWDDSKDSVIFKGTKLPDCKEIAANGWYMDIEGRFTEGYAETYSGNDYNAVGKYNQFDISNAIDANGESVDLAYIDFVKVQTGCFMEAGWLGEISTEVSGALDLNMLSYDNATFEDIALAEDTFLKADASNAGAYETVALEKGSGSFMFKSKDTNWGEYTAWYGIAISNKTDNVTVGSQENQYNSIAGGDVTGNGNYAVVYDPGAMWGPGEMPAFEITGSAEGEVIEGCYITNNSWTYESIMHGDAMAAKFGGEDGTVKDLCMVVAEGFDKDGNSTGTDTFALADYRSDNAAMDYVVDTWQWFDLSSLGQVVSVKMHLESTVGNEWGLLTPAYFCVDNINAKRLYVKSPLDDVEALKTDADKSLDLSAVFADDSESNPEFNYSIQALSNELIIDASIEGHHLNLDFLDTGYSTVVVEAREAGMSVFDTLKVSVSTVTGMDNNTECYLSLYPNPSNGIFKISGSGMKEVKIFDMLGHLVYVQDVVSEDVRIDLSTARVGQYIVQVSTENGVQVKNLMIQ